MSTIQIAAYAKVNLSLEVLRRRADGFHEVRSVMQSIGLMDELLLQPADALLLECDVPALEGDDNLVMRAARALQAHEIRRGGAECEVRSAEVRSAQVRECVSAEDEGTAEKTQHSALSTQHSALRTGARIVLRKGIPAAAGLGGASADAAAALVGLARLWKLDLSDTELATIAASLGSDVPFFLKGGTAIVSGRGELVRSLPDLVPAWLVMLVPAHSLAAKTAELYRRLRPEHWSSGARTARLAEAISQGRQVDGQLLGNSFELVADQAFPGLAACREALQRAGASHVHMSGAGPALFSLFQGEGEARAVADRLERAGHQPLVARTLGAAEARPHPVAVRS